MGSRRCPPTSVRRSGWQQFGQARAHLRPLPAAIAFAEWSFAMSGTTARGPGPCRHLAFGFNDFSMAICSLVLRSEPAASGRAGTARLPEPSRATWCAPPAPRRDRCAAPRRDGRIRQHLPAIVEDGRIGGRWRGIVGRAGRARAGIAAVVLGPVKRRTAPSSQGATSTDGASDGVVTEPACAASAAAAMTGVSTDAAEPVPEWQGPVRLSGQSAPGGASLGVRRGFRFPAVPAPQWRGRARESCDVHGGASLAKPAGLRFPAARAPECGHPTGWGYVDGRGERRARPPAAASSRSRERR